MSHHGSFLGSSRSTIFMLDQLGQIALNSKTVRAKSKNDQKVSCFCCACCCCCCYCFFFSFFLSFFLFNYFFKKELKFKFANDLEAKRFSEILGKSCAEPILSLVFFFMYLFIFSEHSLFFKGSSQALSKQRSRRHQLQLCDRCDC